MNIKAFTIFIHITDRFCFFQHRLSNVFSANTVFEYFPLVKLCRLACFLFLHLIPNTQSRKLFLSRPHVLDTPRLSPIPLSSDLFWRRSKEVDIATKTGVRPGWTSMFPRSQWRNENKAYLPRNYPQREGNHLECYLFLLRTLKYLAFLASIAQWEVLDMRGIDGITGQVLVTSWNTFELFPNSILSWTIMTCSEGPIHMWWGIRTAITFQSKVFGPTDDFEWYSPENTGVHPVSNGFIMNKIHIQIHI